MGEVDLTQWPKVDMDFLKELISIHNKVAFGELDEKVFDDFVIENKEKLNNPDYLQVFSERISIHEDYYMDHYDMCNFFYEFLQKNKDWERLGFGLRPFIRLGLFEETFKEFLKNKN